MEELLGLVFIIAFAGWIAGIFYYSLRNKEKMRAVKEDGKTAATMSERRTVIDLALAELNASGSWDIHGDDTKGQSTLSFKFQGGCFYFELDAKSDTAQLVFPFFYSQGLEDIETMRTYINKVNQVMRLAQVAYTCDAEKAETDLHIKAGLVVTRGLDGETLQQYFDDIFICRNMVLGEIEEARRFSKRSGFDDMEKDYNRHEYAQRLVDEGELQLQDSPREARFSTTHRPQLGQVARELLGFGFKSLRATVLNADGSSLAIGEDLVDGFDLSSAIIRDGQFIGGEAMITVECRPEDSNPKDEPRMMTVTLQPRNADNETLYFRVCVTLTPRRLQPVHPFGSEETKPVARVAMLGYDLVEEPQVRAKFVYLWKEVEAMKKDGGTIDTKDTEEGYYLGVIENSLNQSEGYDFYRGSQLYFKKRYAEALPWLTNALNALKEQMKQEERANAYQFVDIAYLIGSAWYVLGRYDMACYYLGLTTGAHYPEYTEAYVNALIMNSDPRALSFVENTIEDISNTLPPRDLGDEDDDEDDEDDEEYRKDNAMTLNFLNFMRRSKAHILAEHGEFDEAESILNDLAKNHYHKDVNKELEFVMECRLKAATRDCDKGLRQEQ